MLRWEVLLFFRRRLVRDRDLEKLPRVGLV